jgi:hypothetical protein
LVFGFAFSNHDSEIRRGVKYSEARHKSREALKKISPGHNCASRNAVLTATQNKDKHVFSFSARNTQPLCCQVKVETVKVGSAIGNHGFIFNYLDGVDSSSDEE